MFLRTPSGRLLSRWFSPVLVNYGTDRLGSVTALTGTDQSLQHTYNYKPYGDINYQTGGRYNPYHYTGSYYDSQTALYQMGARYYDQSAGRFTQQDPSARSILSKNRYAYVGCNPVNATDPTGLDTKDCLLAAGAFFSSALTTLGIVGLLYAPLNPLTAVFNVALFATGLVVGTFVTAEQLGETFESNPSALEAVVAFAEAVISPLGSILPANVQAVLDFKEKAQVVVNCFG